MTNFLNSIMNSLSTIWSGLINNPIKSTGTLIISWKNLTKDNTKVKVSVKRAQNGPLILQHPNEEFLIFEIYNQGVTPIVMNEIGVIGSRRIWRKKQFINLVDLAYADVKIRNQEGAIGSLECVGLPGTVPGKSLGVFLLQYSSMKTKFINYQERKASPESSDFVGRERLIKTYQEFQKLQNNQGKYLKITPYVITGCRNCFIGSKASIKLGSLGDAVV